MAVHRTLRDKAAHRPVIFNVGSLNERIDVAYVKAYRNSFTRRRLNMAILTASEARANLYRLIDQAAESHQPIHIAGKRSSAVLLAAEDWDAIQETLYLLSIPGMRESIKEGMTEPLGNSAKELKW